MDDFTKIQNEVGSLGIVFFSNKFVRALDIFRTKGLRVTELVSLCEKAVAALHNVSGDAADARKSQAAAGLMTTPSEIASLRGVLEKRFNVTVDNDARKKLIALQKAIGRIKAQKDVTPDVRRDIDDVLLFFEELAGEGLNTCRQRDAGDMTGEERVWQHYAMR